LCEEGFGGEENEHGRDGVHPVLLFGLCVHLAHAPGGSPPNVGEPIAAEGCSQALLARACLYDVGNEYDRAIADYTRVLELDPAQSAAAAKRKGVLRRRGNHQVGAIALGPDKVDYWLDAAWEKAFTYLWNNLCVGTPF